MSYRPQKTIGTANRLTVDNSLTASGSPTEDLGVDAMVANSSSAYTTRATPAFATDYTPSATRLTQVIATITQSCATGDSTTVNVLVDGTTTATVSTNYGVTGALLGGTVTRASVLTFMVPATKVYRLTNTNVSAGTSTITLVREMLL